MATKVTVHQLLSRQYSPEAMEQSLAYQCMHTCKMSRESSERSNLLKRGEKLRLFFENNSSQQTHMIIMVIDSSRRTHSIFPSFTPQWEKMSFHCIPESSNLIVEIDTSSIPNLYDSNMSSPKPFQILCCSVVKSTKQENFNGCISFSTNFDPVFQKFDFLI
ncbi:predicted protein [Naegleria gruberi]|uniref:Predicted protein n=1 Tax=Naegleria gruberi TaxID=5762 RepID=D2VT18_NAEGR|nr:uncharacterized protein NAEGRDRAFT_72142 [Naegleria gruberi]EFC40069.1 predicted protein [Naegleria gruberi]|eukprot:XP_002672813.1 predicted protein [Naegleria gruberi strain NEG-M]